MVASSNTESGAYGRGDGDMEGFVRGDDRLTKAFHTVGRQAAFEAEREATLADTGTAGVEYDDQEWDETVGDGIE